MLIRYEVRIGDDIYGIFRTPQDTDFLTIVVTKHNSFPKDDNFIQFIKDWMNSHGLKNKLVYGYDVYLN